MLEIFKLFPLYFGSCCSWSAVDSAGNFRTYNDGVLVAMGVGIFSDAVLALFRMAIFEAAHRWSGGQKAPPFSKICFTYLIIMKFGTYTLPKEDPKNIWIMWHTLWVLLTQHCLTRNQQILLYQETQIQISFWHTWVFKIFFNKSGCNFDDVSKNSYLRPS